MLITHIRGLLTPLITTLEPPREDGDLALGLILHRGHVAFPIIRGTLFWGPYNKGPTI